MKHHENIEYYERHENLEHMERLVSIQSEYADQKSYRK